MRVISYWLSLVTIFVIPWEDIIIFPGLGSISRILGFLLAVFWIISVTITGKCRRPHVFHLAVLLFVLWNGLSLFWTVDFSLTTTRTIIYLQRFILIYVLWDLYTTPQQLRAALQAYVLGAYVTIGSILKSYSAGSSSELARYSVGSFNENTIGMILTLGLSLAWFLALSEKPGYQSNWLRGINLFYIPLALMCIFLTGSRSALMGAVPSLLFIVSSLNRFKPSVRILSLIVMIAMMFALQPFASTSLERLFGSDADVTEDGRADLWRKGFVLIAENPILGVGSAAFRAASLEKTMVAHSFVIAISAELGIIGISLFMVILALCFYSALKQPKWNSRLWLAVLSGWVLTAITQNFETRKQTWLFFSLAIQWAMPPDQVASKAQSSNQL